jgi:5'-nucleotidase
MKILLTNDDGIYSKGLWALYNRFSEKHSVTVVAPDRERSAVGHGITLYEPLRASRVEVSGCIGYAVNGTPADCIKIGFMELLDAVPELVVSGINPSANVGVNINYSGTVAAAKEAALYRVPAIAVSMQGNLENTYEDAAFFISTLAEDVIVKGLPFGTVLNVNIPDVPMDAIKGVRISRQGNELYDEFMDKRIDPRNRTYYWHGFESRISFNHPDSDGAALEENFISITPIKCDMTDYAVLEDLKTWNIRVKSER